MEKVKRSITNGPSKEDLSLSVIDGKVVEFTVEELGIVKAIIVSLKRIINPVGDGTDAFYGHVEGEACLQSPNGKFFNDDHTLRFDFDYYLPTKEGSGHVWKGILPEVEDFYRQNDEAKERQLAQSEEVEDEERCEKCGGELSHCDSYGPYCEECDYDAREDYIADAMETDWGDQCSRR